MLWLDDIVDAYGAAGATPVAPAALGELCCAGSPPAGISTEVAIGTVIVGSAALGDFEGARLAVKSAVEAGVASGCLLELLLVGFLRTGAALLRVGLPLLQTSESEHHASNDDGQAALDAGAMVAALIAQNTLASDSVRLLQSLSPQTLAAYYRARTAALGEGSLPGMDKELVLAGANMASRYEDGIAVHLRNALKLGATRQEALAVARLATALGGIPAWHAFAASWSAIADDPAKRSRLRA